MKCTDNGKPGRNGYTEREWNRILKKEKEEKMRNRRTALIMVSLFVLAAVLCVLVYYFVFRSHDYTLNQSYNITDEVFGIGTTLDEFEAESGFASNLCVETSDYNVAALDMDAYSVALFDINECDMLYAKDIFTQRSPASITKIMTAILALKYGNMDDLVTVTQTAMNVEEGSSACGIKVGEVLSLKQLFYGMMVASGNDAAMMIAEYIGGTVDNFVEMMNEEAKALGMTGTHFTNPHGLTEEGHYTTAYDIYLMFNEAMKYDLFMDAINRKNYYAEYTDSEGEAIAVTWDSTNHYFTGEAETPDNLIIYGGKTGTTSDAGGCIALLVKDLYGNPYLAVVLHSETRDTLYPEVNTLLSLIP